MAFSERSGWQLLSNRGLLLLAGGVILLIIITAGLTIWNLRQNAIKASTEDLQNLGVVFAEQTHNTLQAVDLVLGETRERVLHLGPESPEQFAQLLASEEWHQFLIDRLKNLPQADSLALVGADDKAINMSRRRAGSGTEFSDLGLAEYFRLHDEAGGFFSKPAKGRSAGA